MKSIYYILFALLIFSSCKDGSMDLVVYNAKVVTVDDAFSSVEAFAIKDGKFFQVGSNEEIQQLESKQKLDAQGQFIYPGLNDAHCHFTGYAMDSYKLDLTGTKSFDEIIEKVNEYAATSDREWIEGRGWDQNDWPEKKFPDKEKLDELFPDKPVYLLRVDGHAAICNQVALNRAKITCDFDPEGGENILKNGSCTGVLIDNAVDTVKQYIPKLTEEDAVKYFLEMAERCYSHGLTSVQDCGVKADIIDWMKAAHKKGVKMRTAFMLADEKENFDKYLNNKPKTTPNMNVFGYKFYSDGALGSRGAYLIEDYHDRHDHRGFLLKSADSLKSIAKQLIKSDYQMCTHAIGDGAVREMLKIYSEVLDAENDKRWRIEHAQIVHPDDMHYFGDYNIVPSVQPTHATSDMYWAEDRLGEKRVRSAYAYQKLLAENSWMPLGTDFPVEHINPLYTFCSAVWRQDADKFPKKGYQIENAISREDALRGMTSWAAKASFEENEKGSIEVGKYADFIMTDLNLMEDDFLSIRNGKIKQTYIGGELVYEMK